MKVHFRDDDTIVIKEQPVCRSGTFLSYGKTVTLPDDVLERAAGRFNWLPITLGHDSATPIGSTMGAATFRNGVVYQDLLMWDPIFVAKRAMGISPGGFKYRDDGGHITQIVDCNHLALCHDNRLGPTVSIGH